jgi:hypothetical protein
MTEINERMGIAEVQLEIVEKRFDKFENKFEKLEDKFNVLATKFDVIDVKVSDIHARLSKQNGAIPHLQQDVAEILKSLNSHVIDEENNVKEVLERLERKEKETRQESTCVQREILLMTLTRMFYVKT